MLELLVTAPPMEDASDVRVGGGSTFGLVLGRSAVLGSPSL